MLNIENHYFSLCKRLLLIAGLWPCRRQKFVYFQFIFMFGILLSAIIFQFTTFATKKCTLSLIIDVLSFTFVFIVYAIKYITFWINSKTVKFLLEQFQKVCDELKDKNEIAIIEKYGNVARFYMIGFTISIEFGGIVLLIQQSWTSILDVIIPRNETRPHHLLYPMEYFVDEEKYFYLMLLHTNATMCVGGVIVPASATLFIGCLEYICGMLSVASYRIERAFRKDTLSNFDSNSKNSICKGIFMAVDIHRKTVTYCEVILSEFMVMIASLVIIGVVSLSLNLFRVFQIMSTGFDMEEMFLPFAFVSLTFSYMFLVSYIGQSITDHNSQIFITAYNVQWYEAPLYAQKLILFLLRKGHKDFTLKVAAGLFTASLECFTSLMNASMSYFTLMHATQ